eukprot:scaffold24260_cov126-Isochrysis_galbana.AAC.7
MAQTGGNGRRLRRPNRAESRRTAAQPRVFRGAASRKASHAPWAVRRRRAYARSQHFLGRAFHAPTPAPLLIRTTCAAPPLTPSRIGTLNSPPKRTPSSPGFSALKAAVLRSGPASTWSPASAAPPSMMTR